MYAASGENWVVLTLRMLINVMLRCRSVRATFEIKRSSVKVLVNRGCPQGGVLSLLLWKRWLPPLHLFIKQEARQVAYRLLGNGCSYVPNFEHSEVVIRMTDETPLMLAPRDKLGTLYIFDRKISIDFLTREDWFTECVDLVAPDGLIFFTDGSGSGVYSDILNFRGGSHAGLGRWTLWYPWK
jgi:hypothetical protein